MPQATKLRGSDWALKKIKLVVSDFHLGNGRYLPDGSVNTLEDFVYDEQFVEFIEYHGQQYREDEVELIINGDFFNMIQLMPEEQELGILTERAAVAKVEAILEGHRDLFAALRAFNQEAQRRIVFILGNHDPQLLWKGVQEVIRRTVQGEVIFFEEAYRFDGVHVEHGHELEPIFKMRKDRYFLTKGFSEPLLNLPFGVFFVKDYLYRIKRKRPYVDKVSPYKGFMRWCLWNDFWFGIAELFRYAWFVIKARFSHLPLKRATASKGFGAMAFLARSPTLADEVAKIIEREKCQIVVLGHTHIPVHLNLGAGAYLNPGAWNDITHLDLSNLGQTRKLIYVFIEYHHDKPQARLLEWHGFHHPFSSVRA
jgi:UDP-2,3-diacylglucosamine pyrophosphatase LpxH